jgi:hypothetical protein
MGARSYKESLASPGNFFPGRKGRVAELFPEFLGRSFLPLPHLAAVDHHIVRVALSLDLDLAKFHQSRFNLSMFPCLELKARARRSKNVRIVAKLLSHLSDDLSKPTFCEATRNK